MRGDERDGLNPTLEAKSFWEIFASMWKQFYIEVKHVGLVIDVKDVILSSFPYFPPVFVKRIFDFQS